MSVTLTDRDTTTYVLTASVVDAQGVTYSVAGGSLADFRQALARHSGMGVGKKNSRHNFRLERTKLNSLLESKKLSVDITISVPNDGTYTQDDVDDLVTAAFSYFDSEATTGNFTVGVNKS